MRIFFIILCFTLSVSAISIESYLPKFKTYRLDNGLTIYITKDSEQPIFQMKMALDNGQFYDPYGQEGLTSLTNDMLRKGSKNSSSEEFSEKIEFIGGSLGVSTGFESSTLSCTVLSQYMDIGVDLFQDMLLNPIFPQEEISLLKKQYTTSIKENISDNKYISKLYSYYSLLGDSHPQARPQTISSISDITRDHLIKWHKVFYQPRYAKLYIISNRNPDYVFGVVSSALSKWTNNDHKKPELSQPVFNYNQHLFVQKPEMTQGFISFVLPAIKRNSKDYIAFLIFNDIFGSGRFSSRLMHAVRVKGGKSYGAASVLEPRSDYGVFRIVTFTRIDEISKTITIIENEIEKIIKDGITQEELDHSKNYLLGSLSLKLESPISQLSYLMYHNFYGLDIKEIQYELDLIRSMSVEDVNMIIRKHLDIARLNKVVLADDKHIELSGFKTLQFKTLLKDL